MIIFKNIYEELETKDKLTNLKIIFNRLLHMLKEVFVPKISFFFTVF